MTRAPRARRPAPPPPPPGGGAGGMVLHTADEFEAAVWALLTASKATIPDARAFVDSLLRLAQAYAASNDETLTMLRRQALDTARAARPGPRTGDTT